MKDTLLFWFCFDSVTIRLAIRGVKFFNSVETVLASHTLRGGERDFKGIKNTGQMVDFFFLLFYYPQESG